MLCNGHLQLEGTDIASCMVRYRKALIHLQLLKADAWIVTTEPPFWFFTDVLHPAKDQYCPKFSKRLYRNPNWGFHISLEIKWKIGIQSDIKQPERWNNIRNRYNSDCVLKSFKTYTKSFIFEWFEITTFSVLPDSPVSFPSFTSTTNDVSTSPDPVTSITSTSLGRPSDVTLTVNKKNY